MSKRRSLESARGPHENERREDAERRLTDLETPPKVDDLARFMRRIGPDQRQDAIIERHDGEVGVGSAGDRDERAEQPSDVVEFAKGDEAE